MKRRLFIFSVIFVLFSNFLSAEFYFSGFSGGKIDVQSNKESDHWDPQLFFQTFFAGQFNITENLIVHTEFSIQTDDLIENSIFKETPGIFQIDELSIVFRSQMIYARNYLSFFMGTYEPIGSDIFLRRQFGIQPIASKLTESWLGLAGSIIYPLFGIGGSDVIHFDSQPIAIGLYTYVNHELDDSNVLNADLRFGCAYRFFTFDLATGIGTPLKKNNSEDAFIIVNKIYWRGGMNMRIGNPYTSSLFIQAGANEVPFTKNDSFDFDLKKCYLLFEPRFKFSSYEMHLTAWSLPEDSVKNFIFIDDTLGFNLNIFTDHLYIKNKTFTFGIHASLSFPNKNVEDFKSVKELFNDFKITGAPYLKTKLFNGDLHAMLQVHGSDISDMDWYKCFSINIGYKAQF